MIISNAFIGMAAQREYREERSMKESLEFWLDQPAAPPAVPSAAPQSQAEPDVAVDLSAAGSLLAMHRQRETLDLTVEMDWRSRLNMMILAAMYKSITGHDMQIVEPASVQAVAGGNVQTLNVDTSAPGQAVVRSSGPGIVYQRQERYQEQERMQFKAAGIVRTQDGREIAFTVDMSMNREFVQESSLAIQAGSQKIDPLVINFDGKGASLSQTRFAFDLDSDGSAEQIASLRPGSGYLALDRNGDGVINNGTELFGPSSGRGFAELAAYDEDGNYFIDEGDSIYHQLRIWSTNEDGSTQLVGLGDKNIGAIFLGHVSSSFQLKDEKNNSLGEVANSGIYLTEDGKVGVMQEINLTV
ncbi:hypothetical protein [Cellvibrio sp. UBA7661]|uniref:hypothetical protein n=1 Tax=Cellvibrio sp. UBA7661 TaxID=1946311 RepID=UPI002F3543D8